MAEQIWKTSISKASSEGTTIRGYNLEELTKKLSFTETIYLTLKGELSNIDVETHLPNRTNGLLKCLLFMEWRCQPIGKANNRRYCY